MEARSKEIDMPKELKANSSRKPPVPSDSHDDIGDWLGRTMPDLQPIVNRLDELIRDAIPEPQQWIVQSSGVPGWQ